MQRVQLSLSSSYKFVNSLFFSCLNLYSMSFWNCVKSGFMKIPRPFRTNSDLSIILSLKNVLLKVTITVLIYLLVSLLFNLLQSKMVVLSSTLSIRLVIIDKSDFPSFSESISIPEMTTFFSHSDRRVFSKNNLSISTYWTTCTFGYWRIRNFILFYFQF